MKFLALAEFTIFNGVFAKNVRGQNNVDWWRICCKASSKIMAFHQISFKVIANKSVVAEAVKLFQVTGTKRAVNFVVTPVEKFVFEFPIFLPTDSDPGQL